MQRYAHPEGGHLPALERNILKYRVMEMVLVLFYAEELRHLIIDSIRATDKVSRALNDNSEKLAERLPESAKRSFQKAVGFFVADGILEKSEKDEIKRLIDYRNDIAHEIYHLTDDIGRTRFAKDYVRFRQERGPQYDYDALGRLQFYRKLILDRIQSRYVIPLSFSSLLFEPAERTIEKEIKRLRRTINRQIAKRKQKNVGLKAELSLDKTGLTDEFHPYHPANQYESGRLTKRGVEICYRLYDLGKSPLAVAHLMRISLKAAINRKNLWEAAGGRGRRRESARRPP